MTRAQDWSDREIQTLIKMRREGRTYREVAQAIGRTKDAVVCKAANVRQMIALPKPELPRQVIRAARPMSRSEAMTSSFFGDPPAGRSALDQRAYQSIPSNKRQQNG